MNYNLRVKCTHPTLRGHHTASRRKPHRHVSVRMLLKPRHQLNCVGLWPVTRQVGGWSAGEQARVLRKAFPAYSLLRSQIL